jgi:hypothetical protein
MMARSETDKRRAVLNVHMCECGWVSVPRCLCGGWVGGCGTAECVRAARVMFTSV